MFAVDEGSRQRQLWKIVVSTGAETQVTTGDSSVIEYSLSADGTRIAMQRAPSPADMDAFRGEVWVMDANGENARVLTNNSIEEKTLELSPDGTQVLFLADTNERFEPNYPTNLFIVQRGGRRAAAGRARLPLHVRSGGLGAGRQVDHRHRQHGRAQRVLPHRRRARGGRSS